MCDSRQQLSKIISLSLLCDGSLFMANHLLRFLEIYHHDGGETMTEVKKTGKVPLLVKVP
jgi:hypothetical protein